MYQEVMQIARNHLRSYIQTLLSEKVGEIMTIMAFSSSKRSDKKYQFRSISLPSRSHPSTLRVEEELKNFKTCENSSSLSSGSIFSGLFALEKLYDCVDLLNSKSTDEALSARLQNQQRVDDELFNGSLQLLDVCNSTRENMCQIRQHVQGIQSSLRRRKSSLETVVSDYISFRKKMNKDAKNLILSLKHLEHRFAAASPFQDQENYHLLSLIRVLTEVSVARISVFESLLLYLSFTFSSKTKRTTWSLVSILMNKKACQDENLNDFANADAAVFSISKCNNNPDEGSYLEKMQTAHKSLKVIESSIRGIENGLENMFRRLVKTRAFLLNIISQ